MVGLPLLHVYTVPSFPYLKPHLYLKYIYTGKIAAFFGPDSQLKIGGAAIFPGADCHQPFH